MAQNFTDFLTAGAVELSITQVVFATLLAAVLSFFLGKLYVRYGTSLSNRNKFAQNFVLLTITTTLVITIVKSSLALSLGLVGALSIVRFRAAIKEPEELAFLFLCITIGLGLGANQWLPTIVVYLIIAVIIVLRHKSVKKSERQRMYLNVVVTEPTQKTLEHVVSILKQHATSVHMTRLDQNKKTLDALFSLDLASFAQLNALRQKLTTLHPTVKLAYLDQL